MKLGSAQQQKVLLQEALSLHQAGEIEQARALYQKLLDSGAPDAEILRLLGTAEFQLGNLEDCASRLAASLAISPSQPETHFNLAVVLDSLERREEAVAHYVEALALNPSYAEAHYNLGNTLLKLNRYAEALGCYEKALAIKPVYPKAHFNKGVALRKLGRIEQALASYDSAIAIRPDYVEALFNKGCLLTNVLDRWEEGLACFRQVAAINPGHDFLLGDILHTRGHLAQWEHFDASLDQLAGAISRREKAANPFPLLALTDAPELHRVAAEIYVSSRHPSGHTLPPLKPNERHGRIRVGYFSTDFGDHPVTHLLAGLFERHDKTRFEIYAFSLGAERRDPWRKRVVDSVDHFLDVHGSTDCEIAMLARRHEIDIAVDLNGFTGDARTGIFAERAAPVQIGYIGYLGTTGAPYFDYLVADPVMIPEDKREHYSEKIIYLNCYQCNDDMVAISDKKLERETYGLPDSAFVFCSFNNNYKITPELFGSWMRILAQVPGSVLWLFASNRTAMENLRREAGKRGVDSDRLIFAERVSMEEHLARQKLADLFLDTHPYNAGATASNALRVGLPILTRVGNSFASRMGASLLKAVGLPELVTRTLAEYETLAVALASDRHRLAAIRTKLADNLPTCALFDTERFTRNLESAYQAAHERNRNGLPSAHIDMATVERYLPGA